MWCNCSLLLEAESWARGLCTLTVIVAIGSLNTITVKKKKSQWLLQQYNMLIAVQRILVEHWFGWIATETAFAGDIGTIEVWLVTDSSYFVQGNREGPQQLHYQPDYHSKPYMRDQVFIAQNQLELRQRHEHGQMFRNFDKHRDEEIAGLEGEINKQLGKAVNKLFHHIDSGQFKWNALRAEHTDVPILNGSTYYFCSMVALPYLCLCCPLEIMVKRKLMTNIPELSPT